MNEKVVEVAMGARKVGRIALDRDGRALQLAPAYDVLLVFANLRSFLLIRDDFFLLSLQREIELKTTYSLPSKSSKQ